MSGHVVVDMIALALLQIVLVAVGGVGLAKAWIRRSHSGGATLEVKRGDTSMTSLYVFYGVTSVVVGQAISVSTVAEGYKAALILFNYSLLLYLCFFNVWSRNRILKVMTDLRIER